MNTYARRLVVGLTRPLSLPSCASPLCVFSICSCAGRPLLLLMCFEGKYSAVAELVHAFGSWQRCVCEQNASHNTQILACFSDQLDWVPFPKTQSSVIKREVVGWRPSGNKAPVVKKFAWLPVGVNYNKPVRGSVSLI